MAMLSSKNIFLSTQPSGNLSNVDDQIDKFRACLNNIPLQTDINSYAKISLVDFQMYKTLQNINTTNSSMEIEVTTSNGVVLTRHDSVPKGNYSYGNKIADMLATHVRGRIRNMVDDDGAKPFAGNKTNIVADSVRPTGTGRINSGDGKIKFSLVFSTEAPTVTSIVIRMRNYDLTGDSIRDDIDGFSDSYAIFGGRRITSADDTRNSYKIVDEGSRVFSFESYYPMQTTTMPYVYLRCSEVLNNLESENYQAGTLNGTDTHITGSNILAKIPVGLNGDGVGDEVIQYLGGGSSPYFILSDSRVISELFFFLSDEHGRPLPIVNGGQTTNGNLFCNMTINFSIYSRAFTQPVNNNIENNNLSNAMIQQGIR
jgi:hypothetical protein